MKEGYNKKNMEVVSSLWDKTGKKAMVCPKCGSKMIIVQVEPLADAQNAYVPYDLSLIHI